MLPLAEFDIIELFLDGMLEHESWAVVRGAKDNRSWILRVNLYLGRRHAAGVVRGVSSSSIKQTSTRSAVSRR
jgi:hypothetical protein